MAGERDQFIGLHTSLETKDALIEEGKRRRKSLSKLVSDILDAWLAQNKGGEVPQERSRKRQVEGEVARLPGERKLPLD